LDLESDDILTFFESFKGRWGKRNFDNPELRLKLTGLLVMDKYSI